MFCYDCVYCFLVVLEFFCTKVTIKKEPEDVKAKFASLKKTSGNRLLQINISDSSSAAASPKASPRPVAASILQEADVRLDLSPSPATCAKPRSSSPRPSPKSNVPSPKTSATSADPLGPVLVRNQARDLMEDDTNSLPPATPLPKNDEARIPNPTPSSRGSEMDIASPIHDPMGDLSDLSQELENMVEEELAKGIHP